MTVAIFSGSLTQFFLGDWIEDVPDDADAQDHDDHDEPVVDHDPQDVRRYFESFRSSLVSQFKPGEAPDWQESIDGVHRVEVIDEGDYGALMLVAARIAARGQTMAAYNKRRAWSEDAAVRAIKLSERDVSTVHHLVKADTWLPADFAPIIQTSLPYAEIFIGSTSKLAAALAVVHTVLDNPDASIGMLAPQMLEDARRALQAFSQALDHTIAEHVPMVLDL